jgi:hypothetical protein
VQFSFLAFGQDHLSVAHHADMSDLLIVGAVVDEHREVNAYLGGSQTDAFGRVHGGEHVPNKIQ